MSQTALMTLETTEPSAPSQHEQPKKTPLQLICQGTPLPGISKFPSFESHRQHIKEKMALGFRVFARKGYLDGMAGHISVRDPENPHTFWTVSFQHGQDLEYEWSNGNRTPWPCTSG